MTEHKIIPGKFNPSNPCALIVDLVTGARHPVQVMVWPQNQAFLEATCYTSMQQLHSTSIEATRR